MDWLHGEPSLDDVLADPIVHALMQRDGVDPHDLRALIEGVRPALHRRVAQHQGGSPDHPGACGVNSQTPRVPAVARL
jgi:hypothetical protein